MRRSDELTYRSRPAARGALALAGLLALSLAAPAQAGDASKRKIQVWTKYAENEGVTAMAHVPASPETILEFIADGARAHKLAPTTIKAKSLAKDGKCEKLHLTVRGLMSPFEVDTRRCRTAKGFHETMVASEDFEAYDVEWVIQEVGDGSLVSYRALNVLSISVPQGMVVRESKKVMAKTMKNLIAALGEG
ncbi:MAG: hypothetical protein R3A79_20470 [Nannocystaceae bacterium]